MTIPIVIDCDPGHDDAIAILLALASPEVELIGVTSVAGNQTLDKTTRNALVTLEVAGRSEIPVAVGAGETLSIRTSSRDFSDTIMVLLAPDGTAVVGSDDFKFYFAGLDWVAESAATYRLQVTSFESVNTGLLMVTRN